MLNKWGEEKEDMVISRSSMRIEVGVAKLLQSLPVHSAKALSPSSIATANHVGLEPYRHHKWLATIWISISDVWANPTVETNGMKPACFTRCVFFNMHNYIVRTELRI